MSDFNIVLIRDVNLSSIEYAILRCYRYYYIAKSIIIPLLNYDVFRVHTLQFRRRYDFRNKR